MTAAPGSLDAAAPSLPRPACVDKVARGAFSSFAVPPFLHILGGLVQHYRPLWLWLGRLETKLLAAELARVPIRMPIYIAGLARSGSTLLHDVVCSHEQVASHRIKDYPMAFTPYWWRQATSNQRPQVPRERTHRDGVLITSDSPDALEEMLWMAFFSRCHDPSVSNLLAADASYPAFETHYKNHIRKLLLAERAGRYAAKANYHIARLSYLVRLFPDAKFLIPVRAPAAHIASLRRQHQWFSAGQRRYSRALAYMQWSGHFEFGLDRRPMHLGDADRVRQIQRAWAAGEEVRGLAMYWDMAYGYLAQLLASDAKVREATYVVRFESLCDCPEEILRSALNHCQLPDVESIIKRHASRIRRPAYYEEKFSSGEREAIIVETVGTAHLWGY